MKSLFSFGSLASLSCAVISGSEEVPIHLREFQCLTSDVFMTMGEGTAKKYAKVPGTNQTYELCNASQSQRYYDPSELHHQSNFS